MLPHTGLSWLMKVALQIRIRASLKQYSATLLRRFRPLPYPDLNLVHHKITAKQTSAAYHESETMKMAEPK